MKLTVRSFFYCLILVLKILQQTMGILKLCCMSYLIYEHNSDLLFCENFLNTCTHKLSWNIPQNILSDKSIILVWSPMCKISHFNNFFLWIMVQKELLEVVKNDNQLRSCGSQNSWLWCHSLLTTLKICWSSFKKWNVFRF